MEFNIKTNKNSSDFYRIGEEFRLAACRCYGKVDESGSSNLIKDGKIQILPSAVIVNSAFACEMFLKSLLKHNDTEFEKIHELDVLFEKLPQDIQEGIALFCGKAESSDFKIVLKRHAKDFVNARYYVEHSEWFGMSPTFLLALAYNMSQITKAYLNDWDVHRVLEKMKTT